MRTQLATITSSCSDKNDDVTDFRVGAPVLSIILFSSLFSFPYSILRPPYRLVLDTRHFKMRHKTNLISILITESESSWTTEYDIYIPPLQFLDRGTKIVKKNLVTLQLRDPSSCSSRFGSFVCPSRRSLLSQSLSSCQVNGGRSSSSLVAEMNMCGCQGKNLYIGQREGHWAYDDTEAEGTTVYPCHVRDVHVT